jgi:hypothetical protein
MDNLNNVLDDILFEARESNIDIDISHNEIFSFVEFWNESDQDFIKITPKDINGNIATTVEKLDNIKEYLIIINRIKKKLIVEGFNNVSTHMGNSYKINLTGSFSTIVLTIDRTKFTN